MTTRDPAKRTAQNRRYYEKRGREIIRANNKRYVERNRAYVKNIKATTPCADCGSFYPPHVMDFDHLADKEYGIATLAYAGVSLAIIDREIAKCEVVCANCHRERNMAESTRTRTRTRFSGVMASVPDS